MIFVSTYRGIDIYKNDEGSYQMGNKKTYLKFNTAWSVHYYIDEMKSP